MKLFTDFIVFFCEIKDVIQDVPESTERLKPKDWAAGVAINRVRDKI